VILDTHPCDLLDYVIAATSPGGFGVMIEAIAREVKSMIRGIPELFTT